MDGGTARRGKRIYDPIQRFIELDAGEVRLLETAPVQRLRRLHQLGLAYLAFPSAEHSRFTHALGALAVGSRAIEALRRYAPEAFDSERDYALQRRTLRAALLLHDVGHGPFSHASEAVLGRRHEERTAEILARADLVRALADAEIDGAEVLALVTGGATRFPVLRELVSGPNLDADRMDYLVRDAYFTGVASGAFDAEQLVASLRVFEIDGRRELGVEGRGVVALESFVLARYLMFGTVYFHHTVRAFERTLQDALRTLWREPQRLDAIEEYLDWDDMRVIDALRGSTDADGVALRERRVRYSVAAEFNAERDLGTFEACEAALRERWGDAVWSDSQEQLLHRLPLGSAPGGPTVRVRLLGRIVDARTASDLIARISGTAYWRKIFVRRDDVPVAEARAVCAEIIATGGMPTLF